jgi:hypothetical protein
MKILLSDRMVRYFKLFAIYIVLTCFQIGWHWLLSLHNDYSNFWLRQYLSYNFLNGKGTAGFFDTLIPNFILGAASGYYIQKDLKLYWKCLLVLFYTISMIILSTVYSSILQEYDVWWRPYDWCPFASATKRHRAGPGG